MSQDRYIALLENFAEKEGLNLSRLLQTQEISLGCRIVQIAFEADQNHADEGKVICRSDIASLAAEQAESVCLLLLQADNLWAGTHGSTLGLRGSARIMLSVARRIGSLNTFTFTTMLENLVRDAHIWRNYLDSTVKQAGAAAPVDHFLHQSA